MSYTPGPWKVERYCGHPHFEIWEGTRQRVAYLQDHHADAAADAQLIASAPELLEAAIHAVTEWRLHGSLTDSARVLEAAIAKATKGE